MNWVTLVAVAVLSDSTSTYIDNYITDVYFKGRLAVAQKIFFGFSYVAIALMLLFISGVNFEELVFSTVGILVFAGIINAVADITYYSAIEIEDATEVGIFFQLSPIIYLIAGVLFLGESISLTQLLAFLVIFSAPLLIIFSTRKKSRKIKFRAAMYVVIYIIIDVASNMIFLAANSESMDIYQEISFLLLGKGIGNILIVICFPRLWKRWKNVLRASRGKVLRPLILDLIMILTYDIFYRMALLAAPVVALASVATDATEPIMIFFLGLLFTIIWPRFGREKLKKETILVHLLATALVVIGIILLQF